MLVDDPARRRMMSAATDRSCIAVAEHRISSNRITHDEDRTLGSIERGLANHSPYVCGIAGKRDSVLFAEVRLAWRWLSSWLLVCASRLQAARILGCKAIAVRNCDQLAM